MKKTPRESAAFFMCPRVRVASMRVPANADQVGACLQATGAKRRWPDILGAASKWIPAFAGMTHEENAARKRGVFLEQNHCEMQDAVFDFTCVYEASTHSPCPCESTSCV
jgi:hypothetical protein